MIKTLVYVVEGQAILILLRGDHTLSETKLAATLGTDVFRPSTPEEARALLGAHLGSLGPVGLERRQDPCRQGAGRPPGHDHGRQPG